MEDEEQGFWGSVTDTLGDAYDTVSDVASQAVDTVENMIDTDHDGAVIDDVIRWGATGAATIGGAALGAVATAEVGGVPGAIAGAGVGYAAGTYIGSIGEEVGDFISDALGTRDELPYGNDGCTDLDYKEGRQGSPNPDGGLGHQLNEYVNE